MSEHNVGLDAQGGIGEGKPTVGVAWSEAWKDVEEAAQEGIFSAAFMPDVFMHEHIGNIARAMLELRQQVEALALKGLR